MIAEVIVDIAVGETDRVFEYLCPDETSVGSRVFVPFGQKTLTGFVMKVKSTSEYPTEKLKPLRFTDDGMPALNKECVLLAEKIKKRYSVTTASALRLFLPSEMRSGKVRTQFRYYAFLIDPDVAIRKGATSQEGLVAYLKEHGKAERSELNEKFPGALNALMKKGAVGIEKEKIGRNPYKELSSVGENHVLKDEQKRAVSSIESDERTVQLLHGVTGSGKTEVYLTLIKNCLDQGKSAIFLVPEISLTPQMLSQLRLRFGKNAAILHSGLSSGERFDEWWRLRSGEAKIAIGARSAIFAPVENVGVIVIDEEHDSSYFSESQVRYSTFDVAYLRAKYNGCKLVLGSATPSVETYKKATEGEYNLIKMEKRINQKPLPEILIADMRREVRRGNNSYFSSVLKEELEKCLSSGNQAILFLNRRGYSPTVLCKECGYVATCLSCDVALTYHRDEDCLKCHYCGQKYHLPKTCPECGGRKLSYAGTGTERIESELKMMYPLAKVLRMDNDTTSGKEGHYKILKAFGEKQADILVGTQMIAKGHDFPSVTLVGILDADMSLHFSDYRSGERTFQLITQVSGRSGRSEEKGKVVLQTYSPENDVLRYAVRYDYEGFFKNEIAIRKATQFPPFTKIVRILVSSESEEKAVDTLKEVYSPIKELYDTEPNEFLFFDKMRSPIKKIQSKFRYQILMRLTSAKLVPKIYEICTFAKTRDVFLSVEENPSSLG